MKSKVKLFNIDKAEQEFKMEITKEFKNYIIKAERLLRKEGGALKYIHFHNDNKITGTNLSEWIEFTTAGSHGLNGILLDIIKLKKILSIFKWQAEILQSNGRVYIQKGESKKYMDNDEDLHSSDYPETLQEINTIGVLDQKCIDAYNVCKVFSCTDATRYFINGVYFSNENAIVATDGRRMHLVKHEFKLKYPVIIKQSILLKNVHIIDASIVQLGGIKNALKVTTDESITYLIRDIEGQFPNYKRVIPKYNDADHQRVIIGKEFFDAVVEVLQFMKVEKDTFNRVYILKDKVAFSSQNYSDSMIFDYEKLIDLDFNSTFAINAQYLKDLSDTIGNDFDVRYNKQNSAIVFLHDNHLHVIMPMQLSTK